MTPCFALQLILYPSPANWYVGSRFKSLMSEHKRPECGGILLAHKERQFCQEILWTRRLDPERDNQ